MAFTREGICELKALLVAQLAQKGFKISFTVLEYFGGTQWSQLRALPVKKIRDEKKRHCSIAFIKMDTDFVHT